ncbi:MAG: hypothetical protein BGP11_11170 [Rhodobacterales bacterium 65-51]|uniref:DUF6948 domain-containing protein n=1 Tax=uncultured Gemmobacter sp. TaxID=1095917 RepID=UPI00095E76FE|nr:hypothetical protein [uncultured Gemmobacter sp.]OJY25776.1 MAG: hypothetical protein BGP11_11170 [Rhodobacterales bacterium 65-51]
MTDPANLRPILVTTKHRGVFAGLVPEQQDLSAPTMALKEARMAIYWGTTKGLMQLCATGPTGSSKISAPADIPVLHDITAVFDITPEAWAKWQAA